MITFKVSEDVISLSDFRTNLAGCVAQTKSTHRPMLLTQNGRTAAVFLDAGTWDKLQEKLERLGAYEDLLVAEGEADRDEVEDGASFARKVRKARKPHLERVAV